MTVPEPDEPDGTLDDLDLDRLVPLGVIAAELEVTVTELTRRLGPDAVFLDGIGLRCTTEAQAAALIAERQARQAAAREHRRRAADQIRAVSDTAATRARVQAIQAAQRVAPGLLRPDKEAQ